MSKLQQMFAAPRIEKPRYGAAHGSEANQGDLAVGISEISRSFEICRK
jgi:hypothetical protein